MTRASHARIAARAAKFDPPPFRLPPEGMISERIDLIDFELVLGLIHPEGSPMLVVAWDGKTMRRLLAEQATTWADEIALMPELAPVTAAIRKLVRRMGEIASEAIMRNMAVEGTA